MATNYPGSLDTGTEQPSPSASTEMDDAGFEHDVVHTNHSGAIIALETKLGTGSSTAVANSVLAGTGAGTSAWTTGALANDISGNAATATSLATARTIDITGDITATAVAFDGTANIAISASVNNDSHTHNANNLTGSTLASGVTASSLTSVGTLTGLTISGAIDGPQNFTVGNGEGEFVLFQGSSNQVFVQSNGTYRAYWNSSGHYLPYADSAYEMGSSSLRWKKAWFDTVDIADDLYVGANGRGDSWMHFYDDNSNTWRTFGWDDSDNDFYFEGNIQINGTRLQDPGSANNLRVQTAYGYIDLGPQNTTYCHIYTDRAQFYTNKGFNSVPFLYWRNGSGIGGPLNDTSTGTGYRYVFQNQTYGTFFDYTSVRARKEQIVNVTEADAGRWIDALQPVTFIERWMGDGIEPEDNKAFREADMQVGFIADDILDNPDTIHFSQVLDNGEGGFDPAGWKWECVIATCVAEIKASRGREAALEARVAALEAA